MSGRQPALDGLRVIAALAVLATHVASATGFEYNGTPASWFVSRGDIGVPIFFTLSGLLIYRPWALAALSQQPAPAVRAYAWRRALRILPAYWAVVVIALLTLSPVHARSVGTWAQYLLLIQNYDLHPWWAGVGAPGLAQMWSLVVEASFYAVLPLLAWLLTWYACRVHADVSVRARRLLIGIAAFGALSYGFAALEFYPSAQFWIGGTLARMTSWFAPGMALAVLSAWAHAEPGSNGPARRVGRTLGLSGGACWLVAGLVFIVACTPVSGPETLTLPSLWDTEIKLALYTIVAAALVAPATFLPADSTHLGLVLGNRPMRFLGKISYGIFLWQFLVLYAFFNVWHLRDVFHGGSFSTLGTVAIMIVVTVLTVAVATISYYLIENPAQRLYRLVLPPRSGSHRRKQGEAAAGELPSAAES